MKMEGVAELRGRAGDRQQQQQRQPASRRYHSLTGKVNGRGCQITYGRVTLYFYVYFYLMHSTAHRHRTHAQYKFYTHG